ncbi:MAG: hypothetical protein QOE64_457 [Frankiales bacterium]|jgi:hypothetical protein|nr:hypothetical protein [Frankiales bacterium]
MARTTWIGVAALSCVISGIGYADASPRPPARPSPVCQQILDHAGDAQPLAGLNPASAPQAPSLDITSADIASGTHRLTAVIRVTSLAPDPSTTLGSAYTLSWTIGGTKQSLTYRTFADSPPDAVFDSDTDSGTILDLLPAQFSVDPSTKQIAISVTRKSDILLKNSSAKAPVKFGALKVNTYAGVARQGGTTYSGYDTAESGRTYSDLAPTCVKGT